MLEKVYHIEEITEEKQHKLEREVEKLKKQLEEVQEFIKLSRSAMATSKKELAA
ncbi:hypothetical protein HYS94_05725 [Candidatus Daviesbacteria bacterium]|nr:hypothetical protein [Candidatus Daviesbacteria bacterium]